MRASTAAERQSREAWTLARAQHGVISRAQLLGLGFSAGAIVHRVSAGRLHPVARGVYAVGRPTLDRPGQWMTAVLVCGEGAVLSHHSAATLWGIYPDRHGPVELSVPASSRARRRGLLVHRRPSLRDRDLTSHRFIPVTTLTQTLIDLATRLDRASMERMVNEADRLGRTTPPALRRALGSHRGEPGVAILRSMLDRRTFRMTRSELERYFLPLARRAGLPVPMTKQWVNGFEVDFYWPDLSFVVETDGLQYHRTPAEQARDRLRDQAHTAAGMTPLRFTHEQVRYEPGHVLETLIATARFL
jgi:very-short-patch-repair endonuclease